MLKSFRRIVQGYSGSTRVFEVLSHRIRRGIIKVLGEKGKGSFADLTKNLNIDYAGALTFHLKKLVGFIAKTHDGYYELSEPGLNVFSLLKAP
uniref:ArsR family transcriptional regulator n=1 Tax=Ignisphaera aggregans TaxID=334771 RepID=A0A7C4BAY8_9CREN